MYFNYSEDIGASGAGGLDNKTSMFPVSDQEPDSKGMMNASPLFIGKFPCFSVFIWPFPCVANRIENPGANSREAFFGLNKCDLK